MNKALNIRKALASDEMAVYTIINILEACTFDESRFRAIFLNNIDHTLYHYIVAEYEGKVVGFMSCHGQYLLHHNGLVFEIQELAILPTHRGLGFGSKMIEFLETFLSEQYKYDMLELCSNITRKDAHRFYLNNGYRQTHFKFTKMPKGK
jgi:(aminoalkyl)phosphonate N-acetyltransferase